jgi:prophage DNA circulation protein
VTSGSADIGRRLARHEYPQRDIPWFEDMGRKAREYKIEAFIVGASYMGGRDALIKALETAGSGQLVHPWHGTLHVTVSDASLTESTESGGMARFSITFVEAGVARFPQSTVDTKATVADRLAKAEESFLEDFSRQFSIAKLPDFAVADAVAAVSSAIASISPAVQAGAGIAAKITSPIALGAEILNRVRDDTPGNSLTGFELPIASAPYFTPTRNRMTENRQALSALVRCAATAQRIATLSDTPPKTLDDAHVAS